MNQRLQSTRAAVDPVTLTLIVVLGLGGAHLAGWKPFRFLQKKPPTEQVTQLQADLAKAQLELEAARQAKAAAEAAELAKKDEQTRAGQQMAEGAAEAISRIPAEHRTPESLLARDLLARANVRLAAAIGALPPAQQAEILRIVDQALSNVEADRQAAAAALAAKDAEIHRITLEREQIRLQLPVLEAKLEAKEAVAKTVQAELTVKTNEVLVIADKLDKKDREAGSLGAAAGRWFRILIYAVLGWAFAAYVLPLLLKFLRPGRTKNILRDLTGYATGGMLYHDAKKKLRERAVTLSTGQP